MKTRDGFVSNSSTSSFIVAIRKPQTPVEEVILEAIEILAKNCKNNYDENTVESYKYTLIREREELEKDIRFAGERVKKLTNLSKDKKLTKMLEMAKQFDDKLNYQRTNAESEYKWTPQQDIEHLESNLKQSLNRLELVNERISQLEGLDNDDKILSFDKDQWDNDRVKHTLKLFEEHGKIIKVIKATTD
jgi:hypothetical protein